MFGAAKPFGTPTFGATGATFGSAFGQPTGQPAAGAASSLFGAAKPSVSFGTTGAGGLSFGTPTGAASAFGQATTTAASSLFGAGTSTFNTPATGTLFGSATQAKPTLFGTTSAAASPFGAATAAGAPSATGYAFGSPAGATVAAGGLFGATAVTQQQQQQQAAAGGGLFGASAAAMMVPAGTTVKFNPKADTDTMMKNNMQQTINTKHQCISSMKEYESKSLEELRAEDYLNNRKGPGACATAGQAGGLFLGGQQTQQQPGAGLFGATSAAAGGSLFSQQKPLFGGTTSFGAPATSAVAPGTSLFGQPVAQQQQQQAGAGGLFGAAAAKPLFGANAATTTSTFTFNTPASSAPGLFGTQPTLFGAATTQQQQPSLFGAPATQQTAAPLFGGATFQQQPGAGGGLFGQPAASAAVPTFGGFGQQPQQQQQLAPFGAAGQTAGGGLFGAKPATTAALPAFGGFGSGGGGATGGAFGGFGGLGAASQQQPNLFGTTITSQAAGAGGGLFGGAGTGGAFGALPTLQGQQQAPSLFGGQQQQQLQLQQLQQLQLARSGGLGFGNTSGIGFGAPSLGFGSGGTSGVIPGTGVTDLGTDYNTALMQQELLKSQLYGLSTSPYGDRKLAASKSGQEPLPVPTDPLAQKRLLLQQQMESVRTSASITGAITTARPLPPFKPITRLTFASPQLIKSEMINTSALPSLDSGTISFTEGFIPKKSIKKLVIRPKGPQEAQRKDGESGYMLNKKNTAVIIPTSLPESAALTTSAAHVDDGGGGGVKTALNFENVAADDNDDRTAELLAAEPEPETEVQQESTTPVRSGAGGGSSSKMANASSMVVTTSTRRSAEPEPESEVEMMMMQAEEDVDERMPVVVGKVATEGEGGAGREEVVDLVGATGTMMMEPVVRPRPSASPAGLGGERGRNRTTKEQDDQREAVQSGLLGNTTGATTGRVFSQFLQEVVQQQQQSPLLSSSGKTRQAAGDWEMTTMMDDRRPPPAAESMELSALMKSKRKMKVMDLHQRSMSLLGKCEESTMIELSQQPSEEPRPSSGSLGVSAAALPTRTPSSADQPLSVVRARHSIRLVPYDRSIARHKSSHLLDAGLANGRRFRAGWAPRGVLMAKCDPAESGSNAEDQGSPGSFFGGRRRVSFRAAREFTLSTLEIASSEYPNLTDVDTLLKCQSELSTRSDDDQYGCDRMVPIDDGVGVIEKYLEAVPDLKEPQASCSIFHLCKALWGKQEGESREESLSDWLIKECRAEVDQQVESLKRQGREHYLEASYLLLASRRVEEAAVLAQETGDWRLAATMTQMVHSNMEIRRLWADQLKRWSDVQADKYIDDTRLKIYALAAGFLKWRTSDGRIIRAYDGIGNWKLVFGLYLWYGCTPFPNITAALQQYEADRTSGKGGDGPIEPYRFATASKSKLDRSFDVRYHLLRLFADRSYSIFKVLEPAGWTEDPFDFHLSWHLWCILSSLGLVLAEGCALDPLHAQYAFQLERRGFWQRGVFAALHSRDPFRRQALVKQILAQNGGNKKKNHLNQDEHEDDDKAIFVNEFGIPIDWICEP